MRFHVKTTQRKASRIQHYATVGVALGASLIMAMGLAAPASAATASSESQQASTTGSATTQSAATQTTASDSVTTPATANDADLHTWWQQNAEKNSTDKLADGVVRESPFYSTKVALSENNDDNTQPQYDSFTYLSIPRNGNGKTDNSGYTYPEQDGAEFSASARMTMSWSSFEYSKDTDVYVKLDTNQPITSADQVTIRPTSDNFKKELVGNDTIKITVPYKDSGYRFSVEFTPQLITAYNDNSGGSGNLTTDSASGQAVDTEPQNSMMIFAQPMEASSQTSSDIPDTSDATVQQITPGDISDLATHVESTANTLYFGPGTYWMGSNYQTQLPANITWVYLAPGAYVKGSFLFKATAAHMKVTGYGVLSGEQYIYEADANNGLNHISPKSSDCNGSCLKMLQFESTGASQSLDLHGLTVANPPFNSFVMYGEADGPFAMNVNNYQQVGAWYWQTDGLELYRGTTLKNSFFQSNDDTIKLYHSNVTVDNTVIWKGENGPVFQWGWSPRNVENVSVSNTDIIHNRMYWNDQKSNTCVFNESPSWTDTSATNTADLSDTVQNFTFTNTNVEGMVNCAIRMYAAQNTKNIKFDGLHIDAWSKIDLSAQESFFKAFTDSNGKQVTIGNQTTDGEGLLFHNYTVGGVAVLKASNNWASDELGRLDFDADLWDNWDATADTQPTGEAPSLSVTGLSDGETAENRSMPIVGTSNAKTVEISVSNGTETKATLADGKFTTSVKLPSVTNTVRVTAIAANGVMTVKRYTIYAFGSIKGSMTDPAGDDNGPGSYVYPSSSAFNKGSFDLRSFGVYEDGDTVNFVTSVEGGITNPWGGNGMSTQRLNIYLGDATTSASASATSFKTVTSHASLTSLTSRASSTPVVAELPGTNNFTLGAWKKAIVVDGRYDDATYGSAVYNPDSTEKAGTVSLSIVKGNTMVASVPASSLKGIDLSKIGYQVSLFSDAEASEGIGNVRPVLSKACWDGTGATCTSDVHQYRFGGGLGVPNDSDAHDSVTTDSNAIDIFSGAESQAALMSLKNTKVVLPFVTLQTSASDNSHAQPDKNGGSAAASGSTTSTPDAALAKTGVSVASMLAIVVLLLCAGGISYKISHNK